MHTVEVQAPSRGYRIHIGSGALRVLATLIRDVAPHARRHALIADAHVFDLHGRLVLDSLPSRPHVVTFEPGEASKSLATLGRLYDALAEAGIQRSDLIITLGGGVASDLGGLAAATWMRGVAFVPIATTLEAAIDASVGGKTAINHPRGKNLIGAFHQPAGVVIDTDLLATLPERDLRAALAESIKHAAIRDAAFFAWHEQHLPAVLEREPGPIATLIARNCAIKAAVVAADEREQHERMVLNYGHTLGHAIELVAGYALRHGECVALGMLAENRIAVERGLLADHDARRVAELIGLASLPQRLPDGVDTRAVVHACRLDKKGRAGRLRLALLRGIGQVEIVSNVSERLLLSAIEALR